MRGISPIIATLVIIAVTIVIASAAAFTLMSVSRNVEPKGGTIIVQNARGLITSPDRTVAVIYLTLYVHGTTPVVLLNLPQVIIGNRTYFCAPYSPYDIMSTIYPNQVVDATIVCDTDDNTPFTPYEVVYINMRYADVATKTASELYVPVRLEPYY